MKHSVTNIGDLHADAVALLNNVVYSTADDILSNLKAGIDNLKDTWKGADAGTQIRSVISVYNNMVAIRNSLAEYAVATSKVASEYREIQRSNGANAYESLSILSYEAKTNLEKYTDTSDTINIVPEASSGATSIESAKAMMSTLKENASGKLDEIMENWTAGPGQSDAVTIRQTLNSNMSNYETTLSQVAANIKNALSNYGI